MMTSEAGFFLYTLTVAIVCVSVYFCFRAIAWVVANGWRSMLGVVAVRAEAVVEWQDCDKQDRFAWDKHCNDAVLLTHEAIPEIDEDAPPEWWQGREAEVRHLRFLAEQLGERAS